MSTYPSVNSASFSSHQAAAIILHLPPEHLTEENATWMWEKPLWNGGCHMTETALTCMHTQLWSTYCGGFQLSGLIVKWTLNKIECFYNNSTCLQGWLFWKLIFVELLLVCERNKVPAGVFIQNNDKTAVCKRHALVNQGWVFLQGGDHWRRFCCLQDNDEHQCLSLYSALLFPGNCFALYWIQFCCGTCL